MKKAMKNIILLAFTLLCTQITFAQLSHEKTKIHTFLQKYSNNLSAQHKTRSNIRLVEDSMYYYLNGNTYESNHIYKYNSSFGYNITEAIIIYGEGYDLVLRFTGFNNINVNTFDTAYYYQSGGTNTYVINTFNTSHQIIENIDSTYPTNAKKSINIQNGNNQTIETINYAWNGTNWILSKKYLNSFNVNNQVSNSLYFTWNSNTTSWDSLYEYYFQYNANDQILQTVTWEKNANNSTWVNIEKADFTYGTNNKILTY
jgi:hypothetical protein